ncbi:MAG: LysE family translocator [Bacteroidota bacterium]
MNLLLEGIGWGLFLTILVGPILFILIQTGLERGARAGLSVGAGIWTSDFLFVLLAYFGIAYVMDIEQTASLKLWMGWIGGLVLIGVGVSTISSRPPDPQATQVNMTASYLKLFTKGFLINTLNPFTFFFWLTISGAVVAERQLDAGESFLFYGGILGTIICTDTLKVVLAKVIRKKLKNHYLIWVRRIAGVALIAFGIVLIIRVMVWT